MTANAAVAHGVFTFVFTDIAGSTRLWERVPEDMHQALARHDAILRNTTAAYRGRVFKTVGDAFCCAFDSPSDGVRAAIAMQRALGAESWPQAIGTLSVRIGVHTGEAIVTQGDYFGATLNRVARLMAAGHGGQILISAETAALTEEDLEKEARVRDLGAHRLKDLTEPQKIYQLVADGLPAEFPQLASLDAQPNNLPSQISSFVGRDEERAQLRELLDANRLVTVCGPGGIGKTRLALQAAADSVGRYSDGTWMVALADLDDGRLVAQNVAGVLHVHEAPGEPISDTLVHRLATRELFLLLDNAEHVLEETAKLVRRVLNACPRVSVLVTSREPLHVSGERVLRVGPLDTRDAARLFAERAQLSGADDAVERICRKIDGVPLAIELVAARAGALSPVEIDKHLGALLQRLQSRDVSQEARHRTLRATIDWSYRLLEPDLQRLFTQLAVFEGSFSLDACAAVGGYDGLEMLQHLEALVDKSFVFVDVQDARPRYRLLELLHEFACEKLAESEERAAVAARHFDYYKTRAEQWGAWDSAEDERVYLAEMADDMPNVRAALEWSFAQEDLTPAFTFLRKIVPYWQQRCTIDEARFWFSRALANEERATPLDRAALLRRAATLATIQDDYAAARDLTQRALAIFEEAGDPGGTAEARHNLAVIEHRSGSISLANELYVRAFEGFVETGHVVGQITALYNLGQVSMQSGDLSRAKAYFEQGIALCGGRPEHADRSSSFLIALGEASLRRGDLTDAQQFLERALALKRELHSRHDEIEVLRSLSALAIRRNDFEEALHYAREALWHARDLKISSAYVGCFELFAVIFMQTAQEAKARETMLAAEVLRRNLGYVYELLGELAPEIEAIRGAIPPGEIERAVACAGPDDAARLVATLLES